MIWARRHRVLGKCLFSHGFKCSLREDTRRGQCHCKQKFGIGTVKDNLNIILIDLFHTDNTGKAGHCHGHFHTALEGEHHIVDRHVRTVRELDARLDLKGVLLTVLGNCPRFCKAGLDLIGLIIHTYKRVIDRHINTHAVVIQVIVRVKVRCISVVADHQRIFRSGVTVVALITAGN